MQPSAKAVTREDCEVPFEWWDGAHLLMLLYSPTLTAVFVSSSDALLPPPVLLCMLMRLLLLGAGRTMALIGRAGSVPGPGEAGGELAMLAAAAAANGREPCL